MATNKSSELDAELDALRRLARRLDWLFTIPGTRIRVGLDSLLGLIPGIGDAASLLPAAYLIWKGRQLGAGTNTQIRMAANVGLDALVGSVPILGDLFDTLYKANLRNIRLLEDDLARQKAEAEKAKERLAAE